MKRKPARTAALVLLAAFLSLSIFGGSLVITSLQNGLRSYEARLGADIVAVPYQARAKGTFESILLQGIPGMFYMDEQYYEKIKTIDGVERAAPQFYLASTSSGCCSVAVQIIGFDPEQDFTVQPWIRDSYADTLGDGDIVVGSDLTIPKNGTLTFYNTQCRIVAQLDKTGTGLDTAVYTNMNTIKQMMKNAESLGFSYFADVDPDHAVSSVMIKVADGYDVSEVTGDINVHVRHIEAEQTTSMISGIADGLSNVSRIVGGLTVMIWVLAIVILVIAFAMISHERAKEFAILRVMGASQRMVSRLLLTESALISLIGATLGVALAALILVPFSGAISTALDLPYLMPEVGAIVALAAGALALSVLAGSLTAAVSAYRISKKEAGLILREGA
ncbi:MAG: ABC transporter permease [Oscillospiraceae bacterium]|nr:ABC transporter permease [Oscillospiraceae bacterium]